MLTVLSKHVPCVFHKSNIASVLCLLFVSTAACLFLSFSTSESDKSLGFSASLSLSFPFLFLLPTGLILLSGRRSSSTLRSFRFLDRTLGLPALQKGSISTWEPHLLLAKAGYLSLLSIQLNTRLQIIFVFELKVCLTKAPFWLDKRKIIWLDIALFCYFFSLTTYKRSFIPVPENWKQWYKFCKKKKFRTQYINIWKQKKKLCNHKIKNKNIVTLWLMLQLMQVTANTLYEGCITRDTIRRQSSKLKSLQCFMGRFQTRFVMVSLLMWENLIQQSKRINRSHMTFF